MYYQLLTLMIYFNKKQITLEDMLQAGKKPRFKALAYDAYKTWVKTVDPDVSSYEKNWPFQTDEISAQYEELQFTAVIMLAEFEQFAQQGSAKHSR